MLMSVLRMLKATASAKIRCYMKVHTPVIMSMNVISKRIKPPGRWLSKYRI